MPPLLVNNELEGYSFKSKVRDTQSSQMTNSKRLKIENSQERKKNSDSGDLEFDSTSNNLTQNNISNLL
jgi:hypothetical protein